jgi:exopolyphosphatase/guanosine-5'-triphosphate,3'-diphosphate pyrophosphatase
MSKLEAVIEIGSTASRLLVAEIFEAAESVKTGEDSQPNTGTWSVIDQADLPTQLGRDVFTSGVISRDSLLQCLNILNRFSEQLSAWQIPPEATTVIATSAFREAKNRDAVLDRILNKTRYSVRVIDGIEENRLMYISVSAALKTYAATNLMDQNSIILDVGGGSTELMLIEKGKMAAAHSFRLGTVIVEQKLKSFSGDLHYIRRLIEDFIANTRVNLDSELRLSNIQQFIAIGSEPLLAAQIAGTELTPNVRKITRDNFIAFVEQVQSYSIEECAGRFKISATDANALRTSLLCNLFFLQLTPADTILVPQTTIRDGLILSKIYLLNTALQDEFYVQIIASAQNLARKFKCDERHYEHVRMIAIQVFDALKDELSMGHHERMLLDVAAILHDIGMFIHGSDHEIHSRYIIAHSEIFGLNKDDVEIISRVAYLHRGVYRRQQETGSQSMPRRADRVLILKLASILRIADALDRGHAQKIKEFSVEIKNDTVILRCTENHANVLEKIALAEKADLFESVFGYKVFLE